MADLMSDTYEYSSLANKYGNFYLPAVKIYINGTDILAAQKLFLEEISVVLPLDSAGSAQFKIGNIYDPPSRSFKSGIADKFKPGTIVEIALGYYSSTTKIMKGFVYMLGAEFGSKNLLVVTVMDVRKLMMIGGSRHVLHNAKNYSDIFKTIMSAYSKLCTPKVTATDDKLEAPVSQTGTDYDFIMEELVKKGKSGREFFVLGENAYFRERPKSAPAVLKAEFGRELLELEMDYSYLDMEIQVMGYNSYEQASYIGKSKVKSAEPQASLLTPTPVFAYSDPDADNQEKAARRAGALADLADRQSKNGRLTMIGLPEIVPGRYVEVVKLEKMVNRKYYITEVRHRIGGAFFVTECDIGGFA